MTRIGKVESYILSKVREDGAIHMTLIDPEETSPEDASFISKEAMEAGTSAIMIGGSTVRETRLVDEAVKAVKRSVKVPTILFPNDVCGISRYADAIWFMSLLNSADPLYITGIQALASPLIKRYRLEPIPMAYLIIGSGEEAGRIGRAVPIPREKLELAVSYAMAAEYLGMRFVYLEAGSGAKRPVPARMISAVKRAITIPLIVGGGIRTGRDAYEVTRAGADIIVTGTIVEEAEDIRGKVAEIVSSIKEACATVTRKY